MGHEQRMESGSWKDNNWVEFYLRVRLPCKDSSNITPKTTYKVSSRWLEIPFEFFRDSIPIIITAELYYFVSFCRVADLDRPSTPVRVDSMDVFPQVTIPLHLEYQPSSSVHSARFICGRDAAAWILDCEAAL
jgi:hypothetical protein